MFDMTVSAIERVGPETFVYGARHRGGDMIVRLPGQTAPAPGERVSAAAPREKLHLFSADGARRLSS
jgi:sn-glycerol 3-phosphate transport system ATP-binding protein